MTIKQSPFHSLLLIILLSAFAGAGFSANSLARSKRIKQIEFKDISVGNALRILSEQSHLNVVASRDAAEIHVTMFLRDVTALEVIDATAKTYNLWYQEDRRSNIVRLYTVREYRLEKVDFKKEDTEVFTLKNAKNALDFAETIENLFGRQRVNLSFGNNPQALIEDLTDRFELFDMIDGRTSIVNTNIGGGSRGSSSRNSSSRGNTSDRRNQRSNLNTGNRVNVPIDEYLQATGNVIDKVVTDKKAGLSNLLLGSQEQSRGLMSAAIRHQAPIYVGVIGRQNRVLVRTRDADAMREIRKLHRKLDVESAMLMMEVKILSIDLSDGFNSLFDFKIKAGDVNIASIEQTGSITEKLTNAAANAALASAGAFDPTLLATVVSKNFQARLELFEQEGRVTELATPMLLTANQEVSRIFVGEQQPIVTGYSASTNTSNAVGGVGTIFSSILVPDTELKSIGTTLLLTPNINADRTVSIRLLVEQSTVADDQATIPVPLNNRLVDAKIDIVQERTFSGTVVGTDGTAVAVGGLIEELSADREKKVPILGDIPWLGFFFRETTKVRARRELVVIIKPYIMGTPAEAEPVSRKILERNSVHPDVLDYDDHNMDVYRNDRRHPKGYELQDGYKLYDRQDAFDDYHGKGSLNKRPADVQPQSAAPSPQQQTYMQLTRYAARAVRLPADARPSDPYIKPTQLVSRRPADLLYDRRIVAVPTASWRRGGINVTALQLYNKSTDPVNVDYRHLQGSWLAASIEDEKPAGRGEPGDSTYLYLISAQPFEEMARRIRTKPDY